MKRGILLDTGPLVAYLFANDRHHEWAVEQFSTLNLPFMTCEPVITEACFLVARNRLSPTHVVETSERGVTRIGFRLDEETAPIRILMERYANVPMSLADACLVRMAEMTGLPICTTDSDFFVYRTHRRQPLTLITPGPARYMHEA
jgi:uncharacterized protein